MTPNRDDVLRMAREAGIEVHPRKNEARIGMDALLGIDSTEKLERFFALAAEYGAAAEREALCAELRKQIEAVRYHCSDATKQDVAVRALLDALDEVKARSTKP